MRLAILGSRGYPSTYSGFETLVRYLAPYLTASGHEVTVYGRPAESASKKISVLGGVRRVTTTGLETKSMSTLSYGMTATVHALRERYDAVLVLNVANGFYLPLLNAAAGGTVVNVDGIEWQRRKWGLAARGTFYLGAMAVAHWAKQIVTDSTAIGQIWERKFGCDTRFIPYGAEVIAGLGDDKVRAQGLEPGSYVLTVARLVPENNVTLTLDALEAIGPDVPIVVVGDANYRWGLLNRLEGLAESRNCLWLGHISDQDLLWQLWSHCAVYVHGHSAGGTNPALLQALGCGAPTLALDTPFNREVLADSPGALYPLDVRALADRLSLALRGSGAGTVQGDVARSIISRRYRWPDVCAAYERTLTAVAGAGTRPDVRLRHGLLRRI